MNTRQFATLVERALTYAAGAIREVTVLDTPHPPPAYAAYAPPAYAPPERSSIANTPPETFAELERLVTSDKKAAALACSACLRWATAREVRIRKGEDHMAAYETECMNELQLAASRYAQSVLADNERMAGR